ncbi:MAG: hypothetical protein APZ16_02950 [Candidatus Hadarchaeum yellowstonense]|jgi:drug/metabolite transporter (DMT)-like permease|uniref:EamA domain-containing protein n=1 Tax=Hadarchaeum yellowstonense TaxID=1776334 RepID=A0A147K0Y4_HADYE|nr:MAG: hypothetical protein APZ16_02950 [Candidatus Hadarchaeum yellowstonense]
MDVSPGIALGLVAMLCWGTADYFAAKAIRKVGVFKTLFWGQTIGLSFLFLVLVSLGAFMPSPSTVALILITGLLNVVACLAFYRGLQLGKVSIVSPISASWVVVTVILSLIFLEESLTSLQAAGVVLTISGVFLTSFKLHDLLRLRLRNLAAGAKFAAVSMLAWGLHYVFIDQLVAELGWFLPIFSVKAVTVFSLASYSRMAGKEVSFPKSVARMVLVVGGLEAAAFLAYGAGVASEFTAVVAPVAASFPMVTIMLARIFFHELVEINQKIGIAAVLTGLILLSL